MKRTDKLIACPITDNAEHRWVLGSGLDGEETLQVVCKECGHVAYSAHTPGLFIATDVDVRMETSTVTGEKIHRVSV